MVAVLVKGSDPRLPATGGKAPGTALLALVDPAFALARQARHFAIVAIVLSVVSLGFAVLN